MTLRRFPRERLKQISRNSEILEYLSALHQVVEEAQEIIQLNAEALMPLQVSEIQTQSVTGTAGSEQTLVAAGADATTVLQRLVLTNHHSGAETITAHLVSSGASPADANKVLDALPLAAGASIVPDALQHRVLDPGTTLQLAASVADRINVGGVLAIRQRDDG